MTGVQTCALPISPWCESILGLKVEAVQEKQVSLEWTETSGGWNSPGKSTVVGSHSLLQGIFQTQGLNPGLLYCRQILYRLSLPGSPSSLEPLTKEQQIMVRTPFTIKGWVENMSH